jgi:hypothetical protein
MLVVDPMRRFLLMLAVLTPVAAAQQVMGTLSTQDAQVTGGLQVSGAKASLVSNAGITALDHTAPIALSRGGEVLLCSTSQFHLLHSGTEQALLFGLDRGAVELHGVADPRDVILTPDIRFSLEAAGTYDLRVRVTTNGDTCVQNVGGKAPVLILSDPYSATTYRVIPGQHVLFEHGSLREVVDNERSECGCVVERPSGKMTAAEQAHPFPAAESAGLAPIAPPSNSTPDGVVHTQVNVTMSYKSDDPSEAEVRKPVSSTAATSLEPPPSPPGAHAIAHAIGRFFHRIFHPGQKTDASQPKP